MHFPAFVLAFLSVGGVSAGIHLRRKTKALEVPSNATLSTERTLEMEHHHFEPLNCNTPECNKGNVKWSDLNLDPGRDKVVIPCGLCVTVDDPVGGVDRILNLPHGMDVQGSLIFPHNHLLTIVTPFIIVQGSMRMTNFRPVTDTPYLQVILTGTDQVTFSPIGNNAMACGSGSCSVGAQAIVTAGGRMDLRTIGPDCKTWVRLHDVVSVTSGLTPITLEFPKPAVLSPGHSNPMCRTYDAYVKDDFETATTPSLWTGGYGAFYDSSFGFLRVSGRKDASEHAPTLDLLPFQDCLIAGNTYLFSARVRLRHTAFATGTLTSCKANADGCLILQSTTQLSPASRVGYRKGREFPGDGYLYGVWQDFYASFTFEENEIDAGSLYQLLRLRGPDPSVDIDIDDVSFGLVPPSLYPDPNDVCGGNLIMNGDAEASPIHPYPMETFNGRLTLSKFGTGNQAFRLQSRSSDRDSIHQNLSAPQCIMTGAQYSVQARVLFQSDKPIASKMFVRIFFKNGSTTLIEAATCNPTGRSWDFCEGKFSVVEVFGPETVNFVRVFFETENAPEVIMDVDDWKIEVSQAPKSAIVVPAQGVLGCWGEGAEIALTSHTLDRNDAQVRQLVSDPVDLGNGMVRLELDDIIISPVTEKQDKDFSTEVLLLNRNVRFQGGSEVADKGGHLMVMHTPDVSQMIRGVEFRNFGRQGEIGRYPIHMHMCESTPSVIDKNLVIDSNQRCVVIHATHDTTVSENVAFRTKGHCFMLEDGGEMDNRFIGNLGALTEPPDKIVRPGETDSANPSTFWISNPKNEFIGNVAAGSFGNGFWFELQTSVKSPSSTFEWADGVNPRLLPMYTFRDNSAHSNWRHGFRTYPHGMFPPTTAVLENIYSYKNRQDGLFMRSSGNMMIHGGIFADNRNHMSFEITQNITVDGTQMIGRTNRFHEIVTTQSGVLSHSEQMVGVALHVTTPDLLELGTWIKNVEFSNFHRNMAIETSLFQVANDFTRVWDGIFDFWSSLSNIVVDDMSKTNPFDMKQVTDQGHSGVYVIDSDSSLKPLGTAASSVSTVIADLDDVKAFVDLTNRCLFSGPAQKYWYCRNTCLRTVIFSVDPAYTADVSLEIVDKTDASRSFLYDGAFPTEYLEDGTTPNEVANTDWFKYQSFAAALPAGSYEARFKRGTAIVWPTFVETKWGPLLCNNGVNPGSIDLIVPSQRNMDSICQQLIRNGNMEDGTIKPWLHSFGAGLAVEAGQGRGGSRALADINQSNAFSGVGQYVDTRCLVTGRVYDIRVWVRMEHGNGLNVLCQVANCGPKLKIRTMTDASSDTTVTRTLEREIQPLSTRLEGTLQADWNLLYARVQLNADWTEPSSVFVYVERGRTDKRLFLDDFTMTRVD